MLCLTRVGSEAPPTRSLTRSAHSAPLTRSSPFLPSLVHPSAAPLRSFVGLLGPCSLAPPSAPRTQVLETHLAIAENNTSPPVLAPQTLVSCATNPNHCGGTGGCGGATAEIGFNYTSQNGIALSTDYPYVAQNSPCVKYNATVTCTGYTKIAINSASAMETTLATKGPVAVVVSSNWATYGGGIFKDGCLSWLGSCTLDHVVVVVGYSPDYWLVRNSWGGKWGEAGYIRLTRANDNVTYTNDNPAEGNACKPFPAKQSVMGESGVLFDASYPTGVTRG